LGILPWFWSWLASFLVMVWGGNFCSCSYRDCVHTGGEDPQPRSSMTWGPRGSGDDVAIVPASVEEQLGPATTGGAPNEARIVDRTPTRVTPNSQPEDPGLKATSSTSATKNENLWDKALQSLTEENPGLVKDYKRILILEDTEPTGPRLAHDPAVSTVVAGDYSQLELTRNNTPREMSTRSHQTPTPSLYLSLLTLRFLDPPTTKNILQTTVRLTQFCIFVTQIQDTSLPNFQCG
jgi:hypothetical protein